MNVEFLGNQGVKIVRNFLPGDIEKVKFPFRAHEKNGFCPVNMLVEVNNVPVILVKELGNSCQDSLLVGAVDQKYCGFFDLV